MTQLDLIASTSKRDAILFYFFFFMNEETDRVESTTYEHLAVSLNDGGASTARSGDFTVTTVRACVYELERLGAVERVRLNRTRFHLIGHVDRTLPSRACACARVNKLIINNKLINKETKTVFSFSEEGEGKEKELTQADRVVETQPDPTPTPVEPEPAEEPTVLAKVQEPAEEPKENRPTNLFEAAQEVSTAEPKKVEEEKEEPQAQDRPALGLFAPENAANNTSARTTSMKRGLTQTVSDAIAKVDRDRTSYQHLRAKVARSIYEQGLHADLVDRIACAAFLGLTNAALIRDAVSRARQELKIREKSNGFHGKQYLWQTLCPIVKSWYEHGGYAWEPTSSVLEPAPKKQTVEYEEDRPDFDEERILRNHDRIREMMRQNLKAA